MPHIRIQNVTKKFRGKMALNDVTFEVEDRSFTCILGPPGAGKTTLLKIIAGLESPDDGEIYFDNKDVTGIPPQNRGVRMVFQSLALYPHMTVRGNIAFPLKKMKLSKDKINDRVYEVSSFLKISELLDRIPRQLSGGEMQRVSIARAIAPKSDVFLFDEPLVNLDYKLREDMRGELKRMCKKLNQTIIFSTPDPMDVLAMAEHVVIMDKGGVEQRGPVNEVFQHPSNLFAGTYFGSPPMNTIDCSLIEKDGNLILDAAHAFMLDVTPLKDRLISYVGDELICGLRPEYLHISEKPSTNMPSFKAETYLSEIIGSDTILHVKVGTYLWKVLIPYIHMTKPGEDIFLYFDLNNVHIFDKGTGKTIV